MKAIVIGSGMAGLTSAAYLVRAGYQVTVYESLTTNASRGTRLGLAFDPGSTMSTVAAEPWWLH